MRATILILPAEDASWGAAFAILHKDHGAAWHFDWSAYPHQGAQGSRMVVEAIGVGEADLRNEFEAAIQAVNAMAGQDPLNSMVEIDEDHVQYSD